MTRLPNPFADFNANASAPDADNPFADFNANVEVERATRIPKLPEFAGVKPAESPEAIEEQTRALLASGDATRYSSYLRTEWENMSPGTPGRRELYENMRAIERDVTTYDKQAAQQRVINEAIERRQAEPIGQFETRFAKTWPGQLALRAEMGATSFFRSALDLAAKATPLPDSWSANLQNEREFRRAYLDRIEQGGDVKEILGPVGSDIFNAVTETMAGMGPAGKLAGSPGIYTAVATTGMSEGLQEAEKLELKGAQALSYAGLKTGAELALMKTFGIFGRGLGFDSLEEALSGRSRAVLAKVGKEIDLPGKLKRLYQAAGGSTLEGGEEGAVSALHQFIEMDAKPGQTFSWSRFFQDAGTGVVARGTVAAAEEGSLQLEASKIAREIETELSQKGPIIAEMLRGGADAENALMTVFQGESLGPVQVTAPAPTAETGVPSVTDETAAPAERLIPADTAPQEAPGGADVAEPATYPAGIDAALQRAQAEEFVRNLTPEKWASLVGFQETAAPQVEVKAQEEAVAPPAGTEFETAETVAEPGARLSYFKPATKQPQDRGVILATSQRNTGPGAEPTSVADTDQYNFTELTGIEGTTLQYRDAFIDALAAYAPPIDQPAVPASVQQDAVPVHRTREQIRIAARDRQIAHQKESVKRLRGEVRGARELRQDWIDDVSLMIESNVPEDHRGSFFNALRTVKTPGKFDKLLDRVDKWVARNDYQQAWNKYESAQSAAVNLRGDWAKQAKKIKSGVAKLKRTEIAGLSPDELNKLSDELDEKTFRLIEAEHNSAVQNILLAVDRSVDRQDKAASIASEATSKLSKTTTPSGFRGLIPRWLRNPDLEEDARRRIVPNVFKLRSIIDSPINRELASRPETLMADFSETFRDTVFDRYFIEGAYDRTRLVTDAKTSLSSLLEGLGLSWRAGTSFMEIGGKRLSRLEAWREARGDVGGVRMTRGEALHLFLNLQDPETGAKLRERGGVLTHRKRRSFGPVDEFFQADLETFLGDEGLQIAEHIFSRINNEVINPVNETYELVHGFPLTTRAQHFPRKLDEQDIPTKDVEFGERWRQATAESYGHLNKREDTERELAIDGDAIDFYLHHTEKMANYAAFGARHRDVMELMKTPEVKAAIDSHGGKIFENMLLDRINRQVVPQQSQLSIGERGLQAATRAIATNRLALRIGPIAKQALAWPLLAAHSDPGAVAKARDAMTTDFLGLRARMLQNPFAQERYDSARFAHEVTNGLVQHVGYFRPTPVSDRLISPMQIAERESTGIIKQALAEEHVKARMTPDDPRFQDEVNKEWFRLTVRSENNAEGMELNSLQAFARDHALAGPLAMFSSSATRSFSTGLQGLDEIRRGNLTSGGRKVSAVLATVLSEALMDDLLSWEDVPGDWVERVSRRVATGLSGLNVALDQVIQPMVRAILGMRVYNDEAVPVLTGAQDAGQAMVEFANAIQASGRDQEKHYDEMWKATKRILKLATPISGAEDIGRRVSTGHILPGLTYEHPDD